MSSWKVKKAERLPRKHRRPQAVRLESGFWRLRKYICNLIHPQILEKTQTFRPPFLDRWRGSYVGYAVPAGEGLRHRFSEQLKTGVGQDHDIFTLYVTLIYSVTAPEALVERLSEDPLGSIEGEIRSVFKRKASMLRYEDLIDEHFNMEAFVLRGEKRESESRELGNLERFRGLAREFGIALEEIEVTRNYSTGHIESGWKVIEEERKTRVEVHRVLGNNEVAAVAEQGKATLEQGKRKGKLLDAFGDRLTGMVKDVGTVSGLRELMTELTSSPEGIAGIIGSHGALAGSPERKALGTGDSSRAVHGELQYMLKVVEALKCSPPEKTVLTGRLLHVLAEVCLGDESIGGHLESHVDRLGQYCKAINIVGSCSTEEQHHYFSRFRSPEIVRQKFAHLLQDSHDGGEGTP